MNYWRIANDFFCYCSGFTLEWEGGLSPVGMNAKYVEKTIDYPHKHIYPYNKEGNGTKKIKTLVIGEASFEFEGFTGKDSK